MASALFQIDPGTGSYGASGAVADAAAAAVINCRITNLAGIVPSTIAWRFIGNHDPAVANPAITLGGNPVGQIATFTLPAGLAQAWGIECKVNGGEGSLSQESPGSTASSGVYVLDKHGRRPVWAGESLQVHASHGRTTNFNELFTNALRAASGTGLRWKDSHPFEGTVAGGAGATAVATLTPPDSSEWEMLIIASARQSSSERAGYLKFATVKKISNVVTVVGDTALAAHEDDVGWNLTVVQGAVPSNVEIRGTPDASANTTFTGLALIFERV